LVLGLAGDPARLAAVRRHAVALLARHGLADWGFAYNRRKRTLGLCIYDRRTIELSLHFVLRNDLAEITDTLLHEIAHALVGPGHGHDAVWKRKCVEVGARPVRCGEADMPAGRWRATCGRCGQAFSRHRRPARRRGWFCRECGPDHGRLTWALEGGL
jgi:predicted SprT family Zn-dependent metalloprotease